MLCRNITIPWAYTLSDCCAKPFVGFVQKYKFFEKCTPRIFPFFGEKETTEILNFTLLSLHTSMFSKTIKSAKDFWTKAWFILLSRVTEDCSKNWPRSLFCQFSSRRRSRSKCEREWGRSLSEKLYLSSF